MAGQSAQPVPMNWKVDQETVEPARIVAIRRRVGDWSDDPDELVTDVYYRLARR